VSDGLLVFSLLFEGISQIAVGSSVVGVQLDGLAIVFHGLLQLPFISEDIAQVAVGSDVVGVELDGLAVVLDNILQLSFSVEGGSQVAVSVCHLGRLRVEGEGRPVHAEAYPSCPLRYRATPMLLWASGCLGSRAMQ
jgi:hypothetical protein